MRRVIVGLIVAVAMFAGAAPSQARPVAEPPRGSRALVDLTVAHTRWAFERPAPDGALLPPTCEVVGRTTFLPTTFASPDPGAVSSKCTTITGTPIFGVIGTCVGWEDAQTPASALVSGVTACATEPPWGPIEVAATVDGRPVDLARAFVVTPVFDLDLPEGNVLGLPAGPVASAVAGHVFRIHPLPPGQHSIVLTARFADGYMVNVAHTVTVLPRGRG
jgi:hypothetical protein